ncbi:OmpA family protein [Marinactinospora rubrisoli]|uniref:OmpA family protein n=1 Tax=Marinactinospora rubrisoli TaxID=2715399 RepID=A0ABW2KA45_9ACTN
MRRIRRLSALLLSSALLVGLPYVLLVHLTWPEPDLSWTGLLVHLSSFRLPPGLFTAFLICTLWALWGLYALGLVAEIVARRRGGTRWFRPLGPLQIIAATAIGGTVAAPAQAMADTVHTTTMTVEDTETSSAGEQTAPPTAAPDAGTRNKATERVRVVTGFALNSAEPTQEMRDDLATTIELIRKHGDTDAVVRVTGHTDASGGADVNRWLSEQRAQGIADHIAEQLGDAAPEIEVQGLGSEQLREDVDAAAQRRVEISYTVRTGPAANPPAAAASAEGDEADGETAGNADETEREDERSNEDTATASGAEDTGRADAEDDTDDTADGTVAASGAESTAEEPPAEEPADETELESAALVGATSSTEEAVQAAAADGAAGVVVLAIPDEALLGGAAFAGILGGYLIGRRGRRLGAPRLTLSLPRALTAGPRDKPDDSPEPRPLPPTDVDARVFVELNHVPGIGITGSGARGAARRLIANALTPSAEHPARVLITDADAVVLLGTNGKRRLAERDLESVRVVDSMHEALTELQRELHARADSSIRSDDHDPLILIATPRPEDEDALSGLLLHGQERGISAVLLGRWPLGGSCTIEADGLITETSPPLNGIYHAYWPGLDAARVNEIIRRQRGARRDEDAPGDWKELFAQIAANAPEESPAPATADRTGESSPAEQIATEETAAEQPQTESATTGRTATEQNEGARTERAGAAMTEEFDPFYSSETAERDASERPAATEAAVQTESESAEPANPWLADAPTVSTGSTGGTGGRSAANWRESAETVGADGGTVTESAAETPRQDEARDEAVAPGTGTEQEVQRPVPADAAAPTEAPADPLDAPTGSTEAEPDEPGRSVTALAEAVQQQPESATPAAADPADRRPAASQRTGAPASGSAGRAASPRRPAAPPSARRWPKRPLTPAANRGAAPAAAETPATAETPASAEPPAMAETGAESAPQSPAPPSPAPAPRKEYQPEPEPVAAAEPTPTPATEPTPQPQPESQPQPAATSGLDFSVLNQPGEAPRWSGSSPEPQDDARPSDAAPSRTRSRKETAEPARAATRTRGRQDGRESGTGDDRPRQASGGPSPESAEPDGEATPVRTATGFKPRKAGRGRAWRPKSTVEQASSKATPTGQPDAD